MDEIILMKHEIALLAESILHHKRVYYAGKPEISDAAYDKLEQRLRALAPDHPVLSLIGSTAELETGVKAKHARPMLSLEKTYEEADLIAWADGRPLVATAKIDGVSLSLIYEKGRLVLAKTRGNGRIGEDVTAKAMWVADCLPELSQALDCEVRGELVCYSTQFDKLAQEMEHLGLERPTNPRNIVAGILGRKQHGELARYFHFFAFEWIAEVPLKTEGERFAFLEREGFTLPPWCMVRTNGDITAFVASMKTLWQEGSLGIDGAVFTFDDLALHASLGETSHHPRYKLSLKWAGEVGESIIRQIHWATSRLGNVTPVAWIDPIPLSGATISQVTLHNAAHVQAFQLKVGDRIEIVRSGEVIPKFLRVVHPGPGNVDVPSLCSACSRMLTFDGVRLQCTNNTCPAQVAGAILNWIQCAEIYDMSEKRLQSLIEHGMVKEIADLYRLTVEDFLQLPLTKEKMANKLVANIATSRSLPLPRFLAGLGIAGMGVTSWEALLETFSSLDALRNASEEAIANVDGFAAKTAGQIYSGLQERSPEIDRLLEVGIKPEFAPANANPSDRPLAGKTFVITGSLEQPRKDVIAAIKKAGGKVVGAISAQVDALIIADPASTSTKARDARALGVPLWSESDLRNHLPRR